MRSQSKSHPMAAITELRPTTRIAIIRPRPICVPATLSRPARVPCARLFATITVTVGPGTIAMTKQVRTYAM
jgi:hypothetical protein